MTPQDFVDKWRDSSLKESAGSQEHFIDLCRMLGEKTPAEADSTGEWYAFEKGAMKTGGGDGWADVWKRDCFAWEYKGKGKDLGAALKQLKLYQGALDNPPLLNRTHTNCTLPVQVRLWGGAAVGARMLLNAVGLRLCGAGVTPSTISES